MKEENNEIVSAAETISVDYEEILQRAVAVIENTWLPQPAIPIGR